MALHADEARIFSGLSHEEIANGIAVVSGEYNVLPEVQELTNEELWAEFSKQDDDTRSQFWTVVGGSRFLKCIAPTE